MSGRPAGARDEGRRAPAPTPDAAAARPAPARPTLLFVCHGPSCSERGSLQTFALLKASIEGSPARRSLLLCQTSCLDHCATGPNVLVGGAERIVSGVLPGQEGLLLDFAAGGG